METRALSIFVCAALLGSGCGGQLEAAPVSDTVASGCAEALKESRMWMTVGHRRFAITLEHGAAAKAFADMLPMTLKMAELNGNEKHARLPAALPSSERRPGTIHAGDLMLYGSRTLVVFYATFRSPYAYTRLGRIDDEAALAEALGSDDVQVTLSTTTDSP
jgi:hypothetical protein